VSTALRSAKSQSLIVASSLALASFAPAPKPTARTGPCNGVIGQLYDAGGYINNAGAATTVNESFNLTTDKWTTGLAPMPNGTMFGGSAVVSGQLYCLGGAAVVNSSAVGYVQIYQP